MAEAEHNQSRLLSLPAELRAHIWDLATISHQAPQLWPSAPPDANVKYIEPIGVAVRPSLLQVNTQVRGEVLPIYFANNTAVLKWTPRSSWFHQIDDRVANCLRVVKFTFRLPDYRPARSSGDYAIRIDLRQPNIDNVVLYGKLDVYDIGIKSPDIAVTVMNRLCYVLIKSRKMVGEEAVHLTAHEWQELWSAFDRAADVELLSLIAFQKRRQFA